MEGHPPPFKRGRAEVDTSRPFQSVKEAVAVFGERILAGDIQAYKMNSIGIERKSHKSSSFSSSSFDTSSSHLKQEEDHEMLQTLLKNLEAELTETKQELKLLKERESEMEIAVASLNAELHKSMSKLAEAEAMAAAARSTTTTTNNGLVYGESDKIVEIEKVCGKDARLEHSQCLAEILSFGEGRGYYGTLDQKRKKMMKQKPIIPLISDLLTIKKSPDSHYNHLYSCPTYLC